jgi:hypothetical protein
VLRLLFAAARRHAFLDFIMQCGATTSIAIDRLDRTNIT